jgi:hypothetical protein
MGLLCCNCRYTPEPVRYDSDGTTGVDVTETAVFLADVEQELDHLTSDGKQCPTGVVINKAYILPEECSECKAKRERSVAETRADGQQSAQQE